jgi:hypothetical protein
MDSMPNDVNLRIQRVAESAVTIARDRFDTSLDFSEGNLGQLELLLQQANEHYIQASSVENAPPVPIDTTVRVWGSYLGEVIRRSLGGEWIVEEKVVYLQLGFQRLDPLLEVRSRIMNGPTFNVQTYFEELKAELQPPVIVEPEQPIQEENQPQEEGIEEGELRSPKWEYMFIQWNNLLTAKGVYVVSTNGESERKAKGAVKEGKILEFLNIYGREGWEVTGAVNTRRSAGSVTTWTLKRVIT